MSFAPGNGHEEPARRRVLQLTIVRATNAGNAPAVLNLPRESGSGNRGMRITEGVHPSGERTSRKEANP